MDDLLFHSWKSGYLKYLKDMLKVLLIGILKISPKEWQLFRTEIQCMGNTFYIKDKRICIKQ